MKRQDQGRILSSLKLNRLYEIETRNGLQAPNVSIRRCANNTRRIRYISRYRITMHYRANAIKTNADEKRGKFLPRHFKGLRTKSADSALSVTNTLRTVSANDYSHRKD